MPKVVRMHFVCRDGRHVTDLGDGTFDTRFWKVDTRHASTARSIALHNTKDEPSYLQGEILGSEVVDYNGKPRFAFVFRAVEPHLPWEGQGTGEKGYVWSD